MASKKKNSTKDPASSSNGGGGVSVIKNQARLRKRKWDRLKEKYGVESKFGRDSGFWTTINSMGEALGMTLPVKIDLDINKETFTRIIIEVEQGVEELVKEWDGKNVLVWTSIETYEYTRNKVGSGPGKQFDEVSIKDSEYQRTINGTPGVPPDQVPAMVSAKLRKYLTNKNSYAYVPKILLNIKEKRE